jgi:hypothetical protein
MKKPFLPMLGIQLAVQESLLAFTLFFCGSAGAQNLLQNGEFESQLGTTNWTVLYLHGGTDDFEIKDRTTAGSRSWNSGNFGGHFRPNNNKIMHACFTQTITNLVPNHLYTVSGYMKENWWRGDQGSGYDPIEDGKRRAFLVWIEAIGGLGDPTPDGRASLMATNPEPVYTNADCAVYAIDPNALDPNCNNCWPPPYSVKQKPDASGKIEVRLHMNKLGWTTYDKFTVVNGYFDSISLTY